jgi:hypothetical protein
MVNGHQLTVSWHVDDLKVSHKDPEIIDSLILWVKKQYGSIGEVKVTCGKIHEHLGMLLDFSRKGQVMIDIRDYVETMRQAFPQEELVDKKVSSPWNNNLFKVDEKSQPLEKS